MMEWDGVNRRSREPWHLDRKVPITLIFAVVAQIVAFIWYAAKQDERMIVLEKWRSQQEIAQAYDTTTQSEIKTRLSVLETQNISVIKSLEKIEDKIDAIYRRGVK